MIQSPLNYTGGKYRLLPQILPLFPSDIDVFVDLFCGGCNVGINAKANRVIYNDIDVHLYNLYNTLKNVEKETIFEWIYQIIEKYQLSDVSRHGYEYYHCESGRGLGDYNREKYLKMRGDFNSDQEEDDYHYVMLYVLIVYAFNNQLRFNGRGEFNLPVGKRDFNKRMAEKLSVFIDTVKSQDCIFTCGDFRNFDISCLDENDLVYVDPPYLIACATYNEQGGWGERSETELLRFLDSLSERHIRFALSNVLRSKGKENRILLDWLEGNAKRFKTVELDYSYSNSSYQTRDRASPTEEVLIINY